MNRRAFAFGLAVLAAWLGLLGLAKPADAQQPTAPRRIEMLLVNFSPESEQVQAFRQGLRDTGYVEGRDVGIEFRWAQGHYDKLPALAATYFFRCTAYVSSFGTTRKCRRPRIISGY